ncbi:MAG: hypothetical protein H6667_19540 [Ardenticatenaceae bacterium]|nr:hypothetical protein [Ardenticatenaceae bacterium]MCB9446227.1 hypothetical protein [Ardenticatenaceae bacterium]
MTKYLKISVIGLFLLLVVLAVWQPMAAQPAATYELVATVVGSGGTAVAGSYQTNAVIGQAAITNHAAGSYELGSGLWGGGLVTKGTALLRVFLPFIQR